MQKYKVQQEEQVGYMQYKEILVQLLQVMLLHQQLMFEALVAGRQ